jgi:hypothetical protein
LAGEYYYFNHSVQVAEAEVNNTINVAANSFDRRM